MVRHDSTKSSKLDHTPSPAELDKKIKSLGSHNETSILFLKGAALILSELDLTTEQRDQYARVFDNHGLP